MVNIKVGLKWLKFIANRFIISTLNLLLFESTSSMRSHVIYVVVTVHASTSPVLYSDILFHCRCTPWTVSVRNHALDQKKWCREATVFWMWWFSDI